MKKNNSKKLELIERQLEAYSFHFEHLTGCINELKVQHIELKKKQQYYMTRIRELKKQIEKWS
jgi:hypothetical protein